jgi:cell division septum initiation protein DivIVA
VDVLFGTVQNQAMAKPLTPPQVRDAELPRALRGYDVDATRGLLANAAGALAAVSRERDDLRKQVEELTVHASENPTDAERLGAVLITAKRAGDELVAKAAGEAAEIRASAEQMRADVEGQRAELAARARAEADAMVSDARAKVELLRQEADELNRSILARRQELVVFLRSALEQLEGVEAVRPVVEAPPEQALRTGLANELLAQLPSESP